MSDKKQVLILCTGNSCRSQMAEGIAQHLFHDRIDAYSAGSAPSFVHPLAIEVMKEIGIDMSTHRSKHLDEFRNAPLNLVITVCDKANDTCPVFLDPERNSPLLLRKIHWPFEDPAHATGTDDEIKQKFREVRDLIKISFETQLAHYL